MLSSLLAACSGGSSESPVPPPPPPPPSAAPGVLALSAATYQVSESGTTASFMVTRTGGSDGQVSVDITASNGSATAGDDFGSITTTATFTDGDGSMKTGTVGIFDDNKAEPDETIMLTLSNVSGGATLGAQNTALITIVDDDSSVPPPSQAGHYLNDTGATSCSTDLLEELNCNDSGAGTDAYPGQDAEYGRDTTDNEDADGRAGFSFTKLDRNGAPLADQASDYATTPWDCVRDEITGLVWEVKTDDGGLRSADWRYTWFDSRRGGYRGQPNGGLCSDSDHCDTEKFVTEVNFAGICGFNDWRLPDREELLSLVDFQSPDPVRIDTGFFPNTLERQFWTRSAPGAGFDAHFVGFKKGESRGMGRDNSLSVRLVRGGN